MLDTTEADRAADALFAALSGLSPPEAAAERRKVLAMLSENSEALLVIHMICGMADRADDVTCARLKPTQLYWNIIAAIRARNASGDIEHPPSLALSGHVPSNA